MRQRLKLGRISLMEHERWTCKTAPSHLIKIKGDYMNNKVMFSKDSDHWSTPDDIYQYFMSQGFVDPCPLHSEHDNLQKDFGCIDLFINPPYSDIKSWVDYAINHADINQADVVLLIPSRTDTKYFHKLLDHGVDLQFIKGRLKFGNSKNSAPFPSVLIRVTPITSRAIQKITNRVVDDIMK